MKLKFKEKSNMGKVHNYHCPIYECTFISINAKTFYDHLKIVHQIGYFGERNEVP